MILTDDAGMTEYNRACFSRNGPTDVISLAYEPLPGETGRSAEILVNVERAAQVGPRHGGADRELALYLAHGCQHLAGANDDTPARRRRMRRTETRWLATARRLHLLEGWLERPGRGQT